MNWQLVNIILGMIAFGGFCILEALVINGIKSSMEDGNILEGYSKWTKKKFGEFWSKPFSGCIRCMASLYGGLLFWPSVMWAFGFHFWEVPLFIMNTFILVVLNWTFYKRL